MGRDITGLDITQRAPRGVSFAFQQPVRFKGPDGEGPDYPGQRTKHRRAGGVQLPVRGGAVRQGLYRPGGGRLPVRRRAQAHRDRQ